MQTEVKLKDLVMLQMIGGLDEFISGLTTSGNLESIIVSEIGRAHV